MSQRTTSDSAAETLVHIIARELDKPSLYMGGPSQRSLRIARDLAPRLETYWRTTPLGEIVTPIVGSKLNAMRLDHDDPNDPYDKGYIEALDELNEWLEHGDE